MTIRRISVAGLLAGALFTSGVAGCQASGAGPDATASQTPAVSDDPKQALLDSTKEISNGNFRFAIEADQSRGSGVVHQPSRSAQMQMSFGAPGAKVSVDSDFIYIEPDGWVKLKVNGADMKTVPGMDQLAAGKYLHLDQNRVKDVKDLRFDFSQVDPAGSEALTKAVTDVKKTGEGVYAGTIDLTKAPEAAVVSQTLLSTLGSQASSLPFEARLDPQGRLTALTVQVPATDKTKAFPLKVTYSDYGAATAPAKPDPAAVEEAPEQLYKLFNGL